MDTAYLISFYFILSHLILQDLIFSHFSAIISLYCLTTSYLFSFCLILSHLILSHAIYSFLVSPYLILCYFILSWLMLSHLTSSYLVSHYLILFCLTLCLVSSYLDLTYPWGIHPRKKLHHNVCHRCPCILLSDSIPPPDDTSRPHRSCCTAWSSPNHTCLQNRPRVTLQNSLSHSSPDRTCLYNNRQRVTLQNAASHSSPNHTCLDNRPQVTSKCYIT